MTETKNRARVVAIVAALVAFLVCSWLIANWDHFKAGLAGDSYSQSKGRP